MAHVYQLEDGGWGRLINYAEVEMSSQWFFGRRNDVATTGVAKAEIIRSYEWLTPDLRTTLAGLSEAPAAVSEAVCQLLPFGSRAALAEMDLATFPQVASPTGVSTPDVSQPVVLTPLAYAVMKYASMQLEADPDGVASRTRDAYDAAFPEQEDAASPEEQARNTCS
jgi:hypothetical protein